MTNATQLIRSFLCVCASMSATLLNANFSACSANERNSQNGSLHHEITDIKDRIASRSAHFNWCLHIDLLKLYERAGMNDEAMRECNEILLNKPFDEKMIAYLSKGDPVKDKQKVIAQLVDTAQKYTWLTCVVGQCYLTVADIYMRAGDKEQAEKFYALGIKDVFAGTEKYYAEARISFLQLKTGSNPFNPIERISMCRRLIAGKPDVMSFETRNCLRALYHQIGKESESMNICNQLLLMKPNDEYLVNVLSDWQLYSNSRQALANLMQRARTYGDLPCVRDACLLNAADLFVVARQNTSAEKFYQAIMQDKSAQADPYRVVAQVSLNLIHNAYTAK